MASVARSVAVVALALLVATGLGSGADPFGLVAPLAVAQLSCGPQPPPIPDPCFVGYTCRTQDGAWEEVWKATGTSCSTGTPCVFHEACSPAGCGGGIAVTCSPRGSCETAQCNPDGTCTYAILSGTCPSSPSDNPCEQACDGVSPVCQPQCAGNDCPTGRTCCSGYCKSLTSDAANCGACGMSCAAGNACCQGQCKDIGIDTANCGGCGIVCPGTGNGYPVCSDGRCSLGCYSPFTLCSGTCKDVSTDRANCGSCGNVCPTGYFCYAGTCQPPEPEPCSCPSGRIDCCGDCTICRFSCSSVVCP